MTKTATALTLLCLAACEQQKSQTQDQWASTQAVWLQAEAELTKSAQEATVALRAMREGPQAGTAAELASGLDGALNELRKTRITVIEDVNRGLPGASSEERITAAGARMSSALAKVEGRLEAAKRLTQSPTPGDEKPSDETK